MSLFSCPSRKNQVAQNHASRQGKVGQKSPKPAMLVIETTTPTDQGQWEEPKKEAGQKTGTKPRSMESESVMLAFILFNHSLETGPCTLELFNKTDIPSTFPLPPSLSGL
jgi:hypothetical protein